mmetsp:Transcript_32185/g.96099  ORF Transcript_32185/g.96099 Transcript_32185/m.96099 type:complete len:305 (+) Transcript_32185:873-1787(+)
MQPVAWALRPQQLHPAVDRLDRHVERVQEVGPAERVAVHLAVLKARRRRRQRVRADGPEPVVRDLPSARVVAELQWQHAAERQQHRRQRVLQRAQRPRLQRAIAHHPQRVLVVFGGVGHDDHSAADCACVVVVVDEHGLVAVHVEHHHWDRELLGHGLLLPALPPPPPRHVGALLQQHPGARLGARGRHHGRHQRALQGVLLTSRLRILRRVGCAPQNVALEVVQQLVRIDRQLLGSIVQRLLPRAQLHLVRCSVQRDRERRCHCGFARQVDVPLLEFKRLKRVAILACQAKRRDLLLELVGVE